ncbi:MAG: hypothetical protein HY695_10855 [Deltaproteobacteria bacterium]|nr:hypothetical protein [Deltaproteobacteria bacterium]
MGMTACLAANTLYYPDGGGHLWVYLNWALGLRSFDCRVIWLELVAPETPAQEVQEKVARLKENLMPYGLAEDVALSSWTREPLAPDALKGCLNIDAATSAELLLNIQYDLLPEIVRCFRRSVLLDIDPGLLQIWIDKGQVSIAPHDLYFTIGETVGEPGARFPDLGLRWHHTPPCAALDWWPEIQAPEDATFTTVVHWFASACMEDNPQADDKRSGFLPFLDLPRLIKQPLELATNLGPEDDRRVAMEKQLIERQGWRLRHSHEVASTPWRYQRYIRTSRGEFSCAKPSCIRLQNAWISDRTVCYLASGKPAVVQHTGESRYLPDAAGLFRFRNKDEAIRYLELVGSNYKRECKLARALAEEYFDAHKTVGHVLDRALNG